MRDYKARLARIQARINGIPGGFDPGRFKTFNDFFVWHTKCQDGEINPTDQEAEQVRRAWDQFEEKGRQRWAT